MNSYVDFTNQKSIVNPSSVGLLFVVQDAIILMNKCKIYIKNLFVLEPEKNFKTAPAPQHR